MNGTARYLFVLVAALAGTFLMTPVMRWLALRVGIVDKPSARKVHLKPIPLLGGVAIYAGFVLAVLLLGIAGSRNDELIGIALGASTVAILGFVDDRRGLPPLVKILGQLAAGAILILAGVKIGIFHWEWVNIALTLLWVAGITNALNLLDNMNGLSAGVAAVAAGFFLLLSVSSGQFLISTMAAALLGACLGFLRYNFGTATIFMGDAGSLFLGFVLAVLGIKLRFPAPIFPPNADQITWMIPVIVLGIPVFDSTLVVISRLRRGLNPFTTPGKDHLSHRLVSLGMNQREAVLLIYVIGFALGMLAILQSTLVLQAAPAPISGEDIWTGYAISAVIAIGALLATVRLERNWSSPSKTLPDQPVEAPPG
jgi:UDP-GlcNAc:undecaprenyl-phosphate GlcNAc-1-phosphate transferase